MRIFNRAALTVAGIAVVAVLVGCGSTSGHTSSVNTQAQDAPVTLHLNQGSYSISSRGTTISGTVTKGASVTVNGHPVAVSSGRWRDSLHLHIGGNPVEVEATKTGHA